MHAGNGVIHAISTSALIRPRGRRVRRAPPAQRRTVAAQAAAASHDTAGRASVLASLDALEHQVDAMTAHLAALADGEEDDNSRSCYQPGLPPRWWKVTGPERQDAVTRLRVWKRPGASRPAVTSEIASTRPPPTSAIWSSAPSSAARAIPWLRCLST